jgi:flagellar protein FliO/FliZ
VTLSSLRDRARDGRGRLAVGAAAAGVLALAWAASGGELGGAATAAMGVVTLLGGAAMAIRRRPSAPAAGPLRVEARQPLGHDSGVALVEAGGRRLVVGFAPAGVSLVADLGAAAGEPR